MAGSRSATSGKVDWLLGFPGVLLLGLAVAVGFLSWTVRCETDCQGLFRDPILGSPCEGAHTGPTVAIGVLGVLGLGLVVFGLAGRVGGTRLVVAGFLIGGIWTLAVAGTSLSVHRDDCGSLTTPASWTGYPVPIGPWHQQGCPGPPRRPPDAGRLAVRGRHRHARGAGGHRREGPGAGRTAATPAGRFVTD